MLSSAITNCVSTNITASTHSVMVEFAHRQVSLWHQHSSRPGETSMRAGRCLQLPRSATGLEKLNCKPRQVNNHTQVKRFTDKVGSVLGSKLGYDSSRSLCPSCSRFESIGNIPIKDKTKRSFEALSGTVYRPDSVHRIDRHHREIRDKPVQSVP